MIALYRNDYNSGSQSYYPTLVATYSYDPWGTPTGIYDASGNAISQTAYHVAAYNPFRYRGYRYDGDTRLYYLQSRYYDPAVGRFINADGYVSTGQGYLGCNMFTYCGNNPLNRTDTTGSSWKDAKSAFKKASAAASRIIKANFGAGSTTTVTIAKKEVVYIPDPFPITAKAGTKITKTISTVGSSKKTFSVYANRDATHPIKSSSAGFKINVSDFSLDVSLGLDNAGISGSWIDGDITNSFAVKANISELKLGAEMSSTIKWDNIAETTYANVSLSGWFIAALYELVSTGQPMLTPPYAD